MRSVIAINLFVFVGKAHAEVPMENFVENLADQLVDGALDALPFPHALLANITLMKLGHFAIPFHTNLRPRISHHVYPDSRLSVPSSCDCGRGLASLSDRQLLHKIHTSTQQFELFPHRLSSTSQMDQRSTHLLRAMVRGSDEARTAADGDNVRVHYTGTLEDGSVFDSSLGRDPLSFCVGKRQVVAGFDAAVRGMHVGEKKTAILPPNQAYGERRDDMVIKIPTEKLPQGLKKEQTVQLGLAGGQQMQAKVIDISKEGATLDANHALAGKTLTFEIELVGFPELLAPTEPPPGLELATFAAGCFWGVELAFQRVPGVVSTNVGYAQGQKEKPTYQEVCGKMTGHTEAVRVVFDPKQVSFSKLLDVFWERVGKNAVTLNVAGNDQGPQYRSGIYFHSAEQESEARSSLEKVQENLGQTVVTELEAAAPFWLAEDYHQQYLQKGGQSAEKSCTEPIRCYG